MGTPTGKQAKCGCGVMAAIHMTTPKPNARRRVKPAPYLVCPDCGPQFGMTKKLHERLLREGVNPDPQPANEPALPEAEPDTVPDNNPDLPDNPPPKKGGIFSGWVPL